MMQKKVIMKTLKYFRPLVGKENLTCCLDVHIKDTLDKIAERRYVRTNMLIDTIVQNFKPTYEDISFFMKGEFEESFKQKFLKFFSPPKDRVFMTYQVDNRTMQRIHNLKVHYSLSKSVIFKHIVMKFIRDNHYAS